MTATTSAADEMPLLPPPAEAIEEEQGHPSFDSQLPPEYYAQPQSQSQPNPQSNPRNGSGLTGSGLPPYSASKHGTYKDEAIYLAALRAWAEEKKYVDSSDSRGGLLGFYGATTMEERNKQLQEERRLHKQRKMSDDQGLGMTLDEGAATEEGGQKKRRRSTISNWIKRRASLAT